MGTAHAQIYLRCREKRIENYLATPGKCPVTRCNFSCNLQCNSTLKRCKIDKYKFPSKFADIFLVMAKGDARQIGF